MCLWAVLNPKLRQMPRALSGTLVVYVVGLRGYVPYWTYILIEVFVNTGSQLVHDSEGPFAPTPLTVEQRLSLPDELQSLLVDSLSI